MTTAVRVGFAGSSPGPSSTIDRWIARRVNLNRIARLLAFRNSPFWGMQVRGAPMNQQDSGFDYPRYRKLLAEAVDEPKRLALIKLLIDERARDKLAAQETQRSSDIIHRLIAPRQPSRSNAA
jgi:hypothetical protein